MMCEHPGCTAPAERKLGKWVEEKSKFTRHKKKVLRTYQLCGSHFKDVVLANIETHQFVAKTSVLKEVYEQEYREQREKKKI